MASIQEVVSKMQENPADIKFTDLKKVCSFYFGEPRNKSTSHHVYKTPWPGDPRVNIQESKNGKAKKYQVKQVLKAIDKAQKEA